MGGLWLKDCYAGVAELLKLAKLPDTSDLVWSKTIFKIFAEPKLDGLKRSHSLACESLRNESIS